MSFENSMNFQQINLEIEKDKKKKEKKKESKTPLK